MPGERGPHGAIAGGLVVHGSVIATGDLTIEGKVEGSVEAKKALVIEPSGEIDGDAKARSIVVHGRARGRAEAAEVIDIRASSVVELDVRANALVLEEGAAFRGRITMDLGLEEP